METIPTRLPDVTLTFDLQSPESNQVISREYSLCHVAKA